MSSNIRIRRRCQFCDAEFVAQKTVTKYCSLRCAQRAYKKRVKDQKIGIAQTEFIKPELERLKLIANKEVFNTVETCLFLGVSRTTLWRLLKSGCIKCIKIGRVVRIILFMKKEEDIMLGLNILMESIDTIKRDISNLNLKGGRTSVNSINNDYFFEIKSVCQVIDKRISLIDKNIADLIVKMGRVSDSTISLEHLTTIKNILIQNNRLYENVRVLPPQKIVHKHRFTNWITLTVLIGSFVCIILHLWMQKEELTYKNQNLESFRYQVQEVDKHFAYRIDTMILYHSTALSDTIPLKKKRGFHIRK